MVWVDTVDVFGKATDSFGKTSEVSSVQTYGQRICRMVGPVQQFQELLKGAANAYARHPTSLAELLQAHEGVLVHQTRSFLQF